MSPVEGTHTSASTFNQDETVYIDLAWINNSENPAGTHVGRLYDNDVLIGTTNPTTLDAYEWAGVSDFAFLFADAGWHTLRLVIDEFDEVGETNESNNSCQIEVLVNCTDGPAYFGDGCSVVGPDVSPLRTYCSDGQFQLRGLIYAIPDETFVRTFQFSTFDPLPGTMPTDSDNHWFDPWICDHVEGHANALITQEYMAYYLNRESFDGNRSDMIQTVNYSGPTEGNPTGPDCVDNAYYSPEAQQCRFCVVDNPNRNSTGVAIDIVAHEWAHGILHTSQGNLNYARESGALNEGYADAFGATVRAYAEGYLPDIWLFGEDSFKPANVGIRYLADPTVGGRPDFYLDEGEGWIDVNDCDPTPANDYCGVHTNSGVPNKMFYLLSDGGTHFGITVGAIGVYEAFNVLYRASQSHWMPNDGFRDAMQGMCKAGDELDPSGGYKKQSGLAWAAVGVCDCPSMADIDHSGVINVFDIVKVVGRAFRQDAEITDDWCPFEATDVDCSGITDVFDVVAAVEVGFRNGLPTTYFCHCAPSHELQSPALALSHSK
ncbi:MAG TPA: M4 family metallopeptidase [candidate division Zixibacteria bacterium]